MTDELPVVAIKWMDAQSPAASWVHASKLKKMRLSECLTVGWLWVANDEVTIVFSSTNEEGDIADALVIPTANVVEVVRLTQDTSE